MKATFVKNLEGFTGEAALYELDEEIGYQEDYDKPGKFEGHTKYIVVSATMAMCSGPETYVFPASEDGEVLDYGELRGSYRGGLDIDEAISGFCATA